MDIPFNKPFLTGKETEYIDCASKAGWLAGNGGFTKKCQHWLEQNVGCSKALLTNSGTAALEMAALLAGIGPGDEVIMPSFTFVTTASAFVLRGAVPVFVDIRKDTLNLDPEKVVAAISARTKAVVPVHYAGVSCEMDAITDIARRHDLIVIEDNSHGLMSRYKGRPLGSIGHMAATSFHETKNIISGEGGALLINDRRFSKKAEIVIDKGTDRASFFRGEVDKYRWVDLGSSFYPSEIIAAFLFAQIESAEAITRKRLGIWNTYHQALGDLEGDQKLRLPVCPRECTHNAHMYYILLQNRSRRRVFIENLKKKGISTVFHYIPLHLSPAGKRYCRARGSLKVTEESSERLVRLPLWIGIEEIQNDIIDEIVTEIQN